MKDPISVLKGYPEAMPAWFAYLHIGGDAYAAFKTLFCDGMNPLPYAILLQNHGMGGNWNNTGFGRNSLLWQMAMESNKLLPRWLFVASENTEPWDKYTLASIADQGGMHSNKRQLFELNQSSSSQAERTSPPFNKQVYRRHK